MGKLTDDDLRDDVDQLEDDIEESDESSDKSQIDFLKKKQRELITSTIDYNLESISQLRVALN